jgi:branched-subunit amino acid aminotransferase/4-amino-4-deoxychorismate lyase
MGKLIELLKHGKILLVGECRGGKAEAGSPKKQQNPEARSSESHARSSGDMSAGTLTACPARLNSHRNSGEHLFWNGHPARSGPGALNRYRACLPASASISKADADVLLPGDIPVKAWRLDSGLWGPCAGVPVEDRGFRYGMSVFETFAIWRGRAVFLEEHLDRLARAARSLGWEAAVPGIPDCGRDATGVVRIYVTAGPGHPGDAFCGSVYALFEECEVGWEFSAARVASTPALYLPRPGGWKTGNYWQNVDAMASARGAGVEDVLLFNPSGALVCAGMANVFLEVGGIWKTPSLESGARDGVVRAWVGSQMPVEETLLGPDDVARCTACFLTNSRVGVRAVSELDGRPLQTDVAALRELYRDHVL